MRAVLFACLTVLVTAAAHAGEAYRWVDDDGTVHFSDEPREGGGEAERVQVREVNTADSVDVERVESTSSDGNGPQVVMYSASWCGVCDKARAYMQRNDIPFTEYDVEDTRKGKKALARMGIEAVPVIVVGDQRMVGFSPKRFERMYDA